MPSLSCRIIELDLDGKPHLLTGESKAKFVQDWVSESVTAKRKIKTALPATTVRRRLDVFECARCHKGFSHRYAYTSVISHP